jgi:hypothetical protein
MCKRERGEEPETQKRKRGTDRNGRNVVHPHADFEESGNQTGAPQTSYGTYINLRKRVNRCVAFQNDLYKRESLRESPERVE